MDQTVFISVESLRKDMFRHPYRSGVFTQPFSTRARNGATLMLISTVIKEEEEEDLVERPSGGHTPSNASQPGCSTKIEKTSTVTPLNSATGSRVSNLTARAVSSVVTATSKLISRLLHRSHCDTPLRLTAGAKAIATAADDDDDADDDATALSGAALPAKVESPRASMTPVSNHSFATLLSPRAFAATKKNGLQQDNAAVAQTHIPHKRSSKQYQHDLHHHHYQQDRQHHHHHPHHCSPGQTGSRHPARHQFVPLQQKQLRSQASQQRRGSAHLVRQLDSGDVRMALQALQLSAQIHDQLFGTSEVSACSREALLEAASPLYDTAMAAARAIKHHALHSLVKQAVRRYVNPDRGSPDDVLRVILELLTGCGGATVGTQAALLPPPSAPHYKSHNSSEVDPGAATGSNSGGGGGASAAEGGHRACRNSAAHAGTLPHGKVVNWTGSPPTFPVMHQLLAREALLSSSSVNRSCDSSGSTRTSRSGTSAASLLTTYSHESSRSGSSAMLFLDSSRTNSCTVSMTNSGGDDAGAAGGSGGGGNSKRRLQFLNEHG